VDGPIFNFCGSYFFSFLASKTANGIRLRYQISGSVFAPTATSHDRMRLTERIWLWSTIRCLIAPQPDGR
jgi:hypothetical protein